MGNCFLGNRRESVAKKVLEVKCEKNGRKIGCNIFESFHELTVLR